MTNSFSNAVRNNLPSANTVKAESRGFFRALFDLTFSSYITVKFAKVVYVINIIIVALTYLGFIFMSCIPATQARSSGDTIFAIILIFFVILFGWIPAVLHLIVVRLGLEGAIALVRVAQNTSALREKAIGR